MRVVITGGGTGGHLSIASALLQVLIQRGDEVIYVGSTSGQDRAWFADEAAFESVHFLPTSGVVNKKGWHKAVSLFDIFKAFLTSRSLLRSSSVDAVISVGGFSAAPASLAAVSLKIPLFIHEQNAVMGRLNALLKPYATTFFSSYDTASPVKGYPVNRTLYETARVRERIQTVIFLGGSQGAAFINNMALEMAPELLERGIHIIHQAGERDYERLKAAYEAKNLHVELYGFTRDLPALLQRSDLAVSRAGASTLWELCANALPALYIPYPYAAGDHQYYNAKFLVDRQLAWCQRQSDAIAGKIVALLDEDMAAVSRGLMALGEPDASENIIRYIEGNIT
ncbi:MAG: undecaprenyldiphospho-muramoylpentapeptide beta-N-acetylglucosaminyltransferase [Sulfurimonas sp.]|nr:MAG: undecaprenyldiphospho-muramoylpentapeptide beta-N-acetylglucosaminyltransferase [Sulfurimonas sp.]